jgi:hypothetical protein
MNCCILIKEEDGKKLDATSVNPSSSTYDVTLLKPIHTQVVHRRVAHQCQTPLPSQQTTFTAEPPSRVRLLLLGCHRKLVPACLGKGIHTTPSFTIPNPSLAPYTSGYNGRAYPNRNSSYQALYTTVVYIDPIPLPHSLLGSLPNHAYHNMPSFSAYG